MEHTNKNKNLARSNSKNKIIGSNDNNDRNNNIIIMNKIPKDLLLSLIILNLKKKKNSLYLRRGYENKTSDFKILKNG